MKKVIAISFITGIVFGAVMRASDCVSLLIDLQGLGFAVAQMVLTAPKSFEKSY